MRLYPRGRGRACRNNAPLPGNELKDLTPFLTSLTCEYYVSIICMVKDRAPSNKDLSLRDRAPSNKDPSLRDRAPSNKVPSLRDRALSNKDPSLRDRALSNKDREKHKQLSHSNSEGQTDVNMCM